MYSAGIPIGLLVDTRGPRPGALLGAVSLGVGYFSLYRGMEPYVARKVRFLTSPQHMMQVLVQYRCRGYVSSLF